MTSEPDTEERRRIAEQAALWLLTLQSEEAVADLRGSFVDWLRASPLHIAELLRICQLQRDLARFRGWPLIRALRDTQSADVIAFPVPAVATARAPQRRVQRLALLAAAIAVVSVAGSLLYTRLNQLEFRTQLGERREITLADGSVVELEPDSRLIVRYRPRERVIALDHGAALFRVAKNPDRPFVVQAALTRVRAVGTIFNVDRGALGVSVAVVEGRVAVTQQETSAAGKPAPLVLSLQANESVSVDRAGVTSGVHKIDSKVVAAVAGNELTFENETVGEIARRFNLRNATQIEVLDSLLAARRISGVFRGDDPHSFVAFIQAAADVRVSQRDQNHVVLDSPQSETSVATP